MRLHSYLKNNYNLTKSDLLKLQSEGRIKVNGGTTTLLYEVEDDDLITVDGNVVSKLDKVYYLYNKPIGITCTNSTLKEGNLKDLNLPQRVFALGRLDKDSHGLLILTNDGKLSDSLMNKDKHVEKEYIVKVKYKLTDEFINNMACGVMIDKVLTHKAKVTKLNDYTFDIVITEGRNRQIRKMTKVCNNMVIDLERIRIGKVLLGELKLGEVKEVSLKDLID